MVKRRVIIGAAGAVSLAVLATAWLFSGESARPAPKGPPPGPADLPVNLDQPGNGKLPLQSIDRVTYYSQDGDRVTKLSALKVLPKDDFISDLIEPRAEIRFGPDQLLVIEASEGTFYLPGNDPQRGVFRSDVVVTLYQTPAGEELDALTDRDVAVRLFLDETTSFDRDLGRLATDGPVRLTGPDADFKGQGLLMLYNQSRARIESLVINQGEYLRLRRPEKNAETEGTSNASPTLAATTTSPSKLKPNADERSEEASDRPTTNTNNNTPPQFYQADFLDGVTVHVGDGEAQLLGETLSAFFTLDLGEDTTLTPNDAPPKPSASSHPKPNTSLHPKPKADEPLPGGEEASDRPPTATAPASGRNALADASTPSNPTSTLTDAAPPLPVLPARSLFTPSPEDVVVHWAGQMRVRPLDDAPDGLTNPEDTLLALTGTAAVRASAITAEHGSITADEVRYFTPSRRVEAIASAAVPFTLIAPQQGTLTGARLVLDPAHANGTVFGPGQLIALDTNDNHNTNSNTHTPTKTSASQKLKPNAEERSDEASDPPTTSPTASISNLKSQISNPSPPLLDITFARRLNLAFDPDDAGNLQALRQATFLGDVHAQGTGETPDATLNLDAQSLTVDLTQNAQGQTILSKLTAERDVLAQQPGRSIRADSFWVTFKEAPKKTTTPTLDTSLPPKPNASRPFKPNADERSEEASDSPSHPPALAISHAHAQGHVVVLDTADHTRLTADQLDADPAQNKLTLTGRADQPARVVQPDATLTGHTIEFYQDSQTLHIPAPGTITAAIDENDPDAKLHATWQTAMHFDGHANTARLTGSVHAATTSPTDRTRLTSHQLDLTFAPTHTSKPNASSLPKPNAEERSDEASDRATPAIQNQKSLDLREALATTDPAVPDSTVTFAAQSFDPATPDQPLTRLTLQGPSLRFLNHADTDPPLQQVRVDGAGQMLLEDYRPTPPTHSPKPNAAERSDKASDSPALKLSGQGVTYFNWADALLLDAQLNDLRMTGDVRMVHDPLNDEPRAKLFGDVLTADLTETGGLGAWVADDAPRAQLRRVQIDGNVYVLQGDRSIAADHLRYVESSRNVWIWCEKGRQVKAVDETHRRNNLQARYIRWNLDSDRITIKKPRGGVIPIE